MSQMLEDARQVERKVIELRRQIHRNPELSYQEYETAKLVAQYLRDLGVEVYEGVGLPTAVLGVIRGKRSGKTVALRADMDALPVNEETGLPFSSSKPGVMHACGHDAHTAMLLGAATVLMRHLDQIGEVRLIFQPAEEDGGRGGALPMIEHGVMKGVDYVFGLHVMSRYPTGTLATRGGPLMASPDSFRVDVVGRGGHGSAPHETVDPVYISALIVNSLQSIRSRLIDPLEPFVLSVTSIHSGTKDNIIPDRAVMEGTIRTLNEEVRRKALDSFKTLVKAICEAYNAECIVSFKENAYPVTVNDHETTKRAMEILRELPGVDVKETQPVMGGEDFSRFLQLAKGSFIFLGTKNESKGIVYPNHSSKFTVDEDALKIGVASLALLAMKFSTEVD
ncbi:amidohydrolase [Metallosphaera tengchongensis]|uniref:Amidohydrolase n=1 Tax=Metallosphaera tengchongensis TaxID=1532350 RepID=A0A6N0NU38_9CREN|nr:carboxypeptidase CpsA [Metallosphaera tengchongensis]QKR00296.1 amidohydrolase [Metallosphaera tengchongensis]